MPTDLAQAAKEGCIKYFLISYTDLLGTMRAKLVPAAAIGEMAQNGAGFAGFATWLDMTPAHPDLQRMQLAPRQPPSGTAAMPLKMSLLRFVICKY